MTEYVGVCIYGPKRIIISVCADRDLDFSSTTQLWIREPLRERLIGFANGEGLEGPSPLRPQLPSAADLPQILSD